jgi:hypothetical protein
MCWTDGTGYFGLIEFYRTYREALDLSKQTAELQFAIDRILTDVGDAGGASDVNIGPIDVLDKLLWHANGNRTVYRTSVMGCFETELPFMCSNYNYTDI